MYNRKKIGKYFLDFVVGDKVIVELKVVSRFNRVAIKQVLEYLRALNKQLAIIIFFTKDGVKFKRIINPDYYEG